MREERKSSKAKESYMAAVPGIFACLLLLMFSKSINIPCAQVRHSLAVALALNNAQGEEPVRHLMPGAMGSFPGCPRRV
jgi:hypothetical protein